MIKNEMSYSQQSDLMNKFTKMVEDRSTQKDGYKSYGYQAGYYIGMLMEFTHLPEVQRALQREVARWEWEQELTKKEAVAA